MTICSHLRIILTHVNIKLKWKGKMETKDGTEAHQVRQKVTGGTAGPIISPISRKSQFRSMPAALKMQERAPVRGKGAGQRTDTPDKAERDRWHCWANEDPHEKVQPVQIDACHV